MTLDEIKAEVLKLQLPEREELFRYIEVTLDSKWSEEEYDRVWGEEIKRRIEEGEKDPSIWLDGDAVMRELRAKYK